MSIEHKLVYLGAGLIALSVFLPMYVDYYGETQSFFEISKTYGISAFIFSAFLGWAGYKKNYIILTTGGAFFLFPTLHTIIIASRFLTWPGPAAMVAGSVLFIYAGFRLYDRQKKKN